MKPIYIIITLLLTFTSCSKGYYSHIPRAKTHNAIKAKPRLLPKLEVRQVNILPTIIKVDTFDNVKLKLVNQFIIKDEVIIVFPIKDSTEKESRKYINGNPEKGLRAKTIKKVYTPFAILFSLHRMGYIIETLKLGAMFTFGAGAGTALLISLIAWLIHKYQKDSPLFNRPKEKSRKITFLRVFMTLGALVITAISIVGIVTFAETTAAISGYDILSWPAAFFSLAGMLYSSYLWLKMLWKEFSY